MTYFCFIESRRHSVPHMEPLEADNPVDARMEADDLLDQHGSGIAAHVYLDADPVFTILRDGPSGLAPSSSADA
jgi:hypothetical protein